MNGITVHILTTTGPATIQRIREEDSHVASVICLDGRAEALPVSAAYDAFVRKPIGIIEKLTGHDAYRMDVSARVDGGRSWQLAAYIAHAALLKSEVQPRHVFATGEVDDALNIRAVEHISEKLLALSAFLKENEIPQDQSVILLPASSETLPTSFEGIPVYGIGSISDAMDIVQLDDLETPDTKASPPLSRAIQAGKRRWIKWAALFSIIGLLFWFGADFARWQAIANQGRAFELEEMLNRSSGLMASMQIRTFRKWLSFHRPKGDFIKFDGVTSIALDATSCQRADDVRRKPITEMFSGPETVCEIEMGAYLEDPNLRVVGRMAYWPNGLGVRDRAARTMRGHDQPNGRTWVLPFDDVPQPGAVVRLVTITGVSGIQGSQPWYQDLLRAQQASPAFVSARHRIERLGYSVTVKDWVRK